MNGVPELVIGDQHEAGQPLLHTVTTGAFMKDGGLVVGNAGAAEVLVFDRHGRLEATVGGEGEGPGEFRWITSIRQLEDGRVLIYDQRLGRMTFVDEAFGVSETRAVFVPSGMPATDVLAVDQDGIVAVEAGPTAGYGGGGAAGLVTSAAVYFWLGNQGSVDTIATAPGDELFLLRSSSGDFGGFMIPLFGMQHTAAVDGERLFVRTGRGSEVAVYDVAGSTIEGLIRWVTEARQVDRADIEEALRDVFPDDPNAAQRFDLPVPATKPAFGRLMTDPDGNLWVSEYSLYQQDPKRWWVVDVDGAVVGAVMLPGGFGLLDIGRDHLLVRKTDDVGRETVQVLRYERTTG